MCSESCKTETSQVLWLVNLCLSNRDPALGLSHVGPYIVLDLQKHMLLPPPLMHTAPPQACYIYFT